MTFQHLWASFCRADSDLERNRISHLIERLLA